MFRDQDQKLLEALIFREKAERGGKQRRHTVTARNERRRQGGDLRKDRSAQCK